MNHLVIGLGEVGSALQEVLECPGIDKGDVVVPTDVIHVCFPFSANFERLVRDYKATTGAKYTIVHSTVPIGTSERLNAYHSPIRGVHPNLAEGIRTFPKFIGPHCPEVTDDLKQINWYHAPSSRDTEAMKLWDTTQYGYRYLLRRRYTGTARRTTSTSTPSISMQTRHTTRVTVN